MSSAASHEIRTTTVLFCGWRLVVCVWALRWVVVVLGTDDGQVLPNPVKETLPRGLGFIYI
jgi:hypothetical protein